MIELSQTDIVDLVMDKIRSYGTSKRGTYNEADPTECESGKCTFIFGGEYKVEALFYDSTWMVHFHVKTPSGMTKGTFNRSSPGKTGEWYDVEGELFKQLRNIAMTD